MNDDQRSGDDIDVRLERLGNEPVDVSNERLDAIEARVSASIQQQDDDEHLTTVTVFTTGAPRRITGRTSTWPRVALVAAAVAVLAALSVATLGMRDDTLVVAAADKVTVLLPDGGSLVAIDGTELPDASVLEVSGFIEVGGRRYGPGRYRVEDGRLVPVGDDAPQVVNTDGDSIDISTPPETPALDGDTPDVRRPSATSPSATAPTIAQTTTTVLRSTSPEPPVTRPAPTTPPRTTVPDRAPQRPTTTVPAPTTTAPTRPPAIDPTIRPTPASTTVPATTTTTTTTTTTATTTTSTTVVRGRPSEAEPVREP